MFKRVIASRAVTALYIRLSTKSQNSDSMSIDNQRLLLNSYIANDSNFVGRDFRVCG
jgi:hypothetical protein